MALILQRGSDLTAALAEGMSEARARTRAVVAPYEEAVLRRQHHPLMSPLVWDVAHMANYEDLWLVRALGGAATRPELDDLYDAFKQPRAGRSALPILSPDAATTYADEVRGKALELLASADLDPAGPDPLLHDGFVHAMVVQHEQQHIETLLAAIQLLPEDEGHVRAAAPAPARVPGTRTGGEVLVPAGAFTMGSAHPWSYDNERPRHERWVDAFHIDVAPVTNEAYAAFVDAGGYDDPRWWSAAGWAWRQEASLVAPGQWRRTSGGAWWRNRFGVVEPVPPDEPVQHVGWYEADAYARWAGKRLPTEAEWEKAAAFDPATGGSRPWPWGDDAPDAARANLGGRHLGPSSVGAHPTGASAVGCQQMVGDVWEWTSTDFGPHPGFAAFPYDEYSSVFHGSDYKVLRGGSWATDPAACRTTFRNWDYPIRRQIFCGFRCARDAGPGEGRP
jgi:iron(II)-dependent oxidoreductase